MDAKDGASDLTSSTKKKSRRPKYSQFTQQELPACKPILTPAWVILIFVAIGIVFLPIGFASLFASEHVVEIVDHYDKDCVPRNYVDNKLAYIQSSKTNKTCIRRVTAQGGHMGFWMQKIWTLMKHATKNVHLPVVFQIPKQMKSPVYIYYQLDHFYQNHRRYVKSRSDGQLRSKSNEKKTDTCAPERYTANGAIVPCGLVAWSLFNDTYKFSVNNKQLGVSKKDITWKSDPKKKFGSDVYPKNFQSGGLIGGAKLNSSIPLSEQEDLMVWMRTSALPTFRKLYGKIEADLEADDVVTVTIENNYNTYIFGGNKKLVLSTASWIGGKNCLLGIAYLTVGGLCLFLAISFLLLYLFKPRPLGDTSYLSWNKSAPGGHIY